MKCSCSKSEGLRFIKGVFYFLRPLFWGSNSGLDVYIGKAVCNEKCKYGLGRGFFLFYS